MKKYALEHRTMYHYSKPVVESTHTIHLMPRNEPGQVWKNFQIEIYPQPSEQKIVEDQFNNTVLLIKEKTSHTDFSVLVKSIISVDNKNNPTIDNNDIWLQKSSLVSWNDDVIKFAKEIFKPYRPRLDAVMDLIHKIKTEFTYAPNSTIIGTSVGDILERKCGVCQDFAHFMIACCRCMGIPAQYVSGYLNTGSGSVGTGATHAWVSVYIPDRGFIDFDPTNDCVVNDDYIVLCRGRDYNDISPISGLLTGGGQQTMHVVVQVDEIKE
ncbi:MAG: transglutaminase family protein [Alphaproteobacteria bacterium]|nr:transglutaminase family protein [Alphaproteobacteria bacterium]